jgi:hypothetical protein
MLSLLVVQDFFKLALVDGLAAGWANVVALANALQQG